MENIFDTDGNGIIIETDGDGKDCVWFGFRSRGLSNSLSGGSTFSMVRFGAGRGGLSATITLQGDQFSTL